MFIVAYVFFHGLRTPVDDATRAYYLLLFVFFLWTKATSTPSMVLHSRELVVRRKGAGKKAAENWSAAELDNLELVSAQKITEYTYHTNQANLKLFFCRWISAAFDRLFALLRRRGVPPPRLQRPRWGTALSAP